MWLLFTLVVSEPEDKFVLGNLTSELNARIEFCIVQVHLKLKNKIAKFTLGAKEGIGTTLNSLSHNGSVLNPVSGMTAVNGPPIQGFTIE